MWGNMGWWLNTLIWMAIGSTMLWSKWVITLFLVIIFAYLLLLKMLQRNILNSHFYLYLEHINYGCFNESTRIVLTSISLELSQRKTFPKWTHWITLQTSCSQRKGRSLGKCSPIPTLASQKNSSLLSLFIMYPQIQGDLVNAKFPVRAVLCLS